MKVTVIVPNYNHGNFLTTRIESILNQTFQDFELILLDDCSKDNSKEIIEQYRSHPKVSHIILNEVNSGSTFKQWEKGIALAKGEWIWIAESDDYCEPILLETLINNAQSSANIVVSYCQSYLVDEYNNQIGDMTSHTDSLDRYRWKADFFNEGYKEIEGYLLYKNTIPNASAVIFKKSAYAAADKSFKEMKLCGDWMFWVQLLTIGDIIFCGRPLNYFRTHAATTRAFSSYSKSKVRKEEEYKVVLDLMQQHTGISKKIFKNRKKEITKAYSLLFTKKEIIQIVLNPSSYKGKIPLFEMLSSRLMITFDK